MNRAMTDFDALTFDCYGTLIDWESGIWDALQPLLRSAGRSDIVRQSGLMAFAEAESAQQAAEPGMLYPQVLEHTHRALAARWGIETTAKLDTAFGKSVRRWPAFPDSADALRRLARHYKLVILSNVDRDSFAASNDKLGVDFDAIYTAEDVGSYKPNPANFAYMLDHLARDHGIAPDRVLHTAQSLFHDHVPARDAGLTRCWIDRQGLADGGAWGATAVVSDRPSVAFHFPTMMAMARAVDGV